MSRSTMLTDSPILVGDSLDTLRTLPDQSVRCCVTSPPYWGLRDYGHDGQIGLEETPEAYVARLVAVFAEVRRVLADDGTLWLNIGDSYHGGGSTTDNGQNTRLYEHSTTLQGRHTAGSCNRRPKARGYDGYRPKDLIGIPWRLAFALQAQGWYLRSSIIWHKTNPMPSAAKDRPTAAHESVFLLTKGPRYYYDHEAVRDRDDGHDRNLQSVWPIATAGYSGAHFAVMPPALAGRCIRAGSAIGDTILDPFSGAGTTGMVARRLQRQYIGIELNPEFADMARRRIDSDAPLFNRKL